MKNIIITTLFLLLFSVMSFAQSDVSEPRCGLPFSSYSFKISWNDERAQLDNFAYYLKKEPKLIGYIFVLTNENEISGQARQRANKIIKYLSKNIETNLRVEKNQLVINFSKTLNESEIILQPTAKGSKPPKF